MWIFLKHHRMIVPGRWQIACGPKSLDEVVGQDHLLGDDGPLGRMVHVGKMSSLILWGPPGTGKTTIARLLAGHADLAFEQISAIFFWCR